MTSRERRVAHHPHHRIRLRTIALLTAAIVVLSGALTACGGTSIRPAQLQSSISATFARLYVRQQVLEGNQQPSVASLQARASCQKGTRSTAQSGAGDDWVCQITFVVAAPAAATAPAPPVTALYNVDVETDGCYAADGVGPVSVNGTRTITGPGNQQRLNPLWLIDGCFDIG